MLETESRHHNEEPQHYQWIQKGFKNLRNNPDIIICPAEKENATVILNRTEYEDKIEALLQDPCYSVIQSNPTKKFEEEIQKMCMNLFKMKRLTEDDYKSIVPLHSRIPRFYGLPKVHNEGRPLRPIVDYRNSPAYKLARFLKIILLCLINNVYCTKNAYEMSGFLKDMTISEEHELASFDVVSLFTRVPVEDTLQYIEELLDTHNSWRQHTKLTKREVMKLLRLCVTCNYFQWKERIYLQKDGCPMGSPISPAIAELAMQKFESCIIRNNPDLEFFKRYIDDSLAAIPKGSCDRILAAMNSYHVDIQFTCELVHDNKIAFLDMQIIREPTGRIRKTIYRKPTHTGRYLNYNSYHHISQKMSVVDSLSFRALVICDEEYIDVELDKIRKDLLSNNYPLGFINKRIEKMQLKIRNYENQVIPLEDVPIRLILPFMGIITTRITNFFRQHVECEFGYIPGTKIGSLVCNMKQKLNIAPPGVYIMTCSCSLKYIGESSRPFTERIEDHFRKSSNSAVSEHLKNNPDHIMTIDSASLLEVEPRYFHREAKEGLYIQKLDDELKLNKNNGKTLNPIISTFLLQLIPNP